MLNDFPITDKPLAFSYIRMSTAVQLRGDSLRRQKELSKRYADENGLYLVEDFSLEDIGVSAFSGANYQRGALRNFLNAVEKAQIPKGSFLLVESLDRLSREKISLALSNFLALVEAGINVVTLSDMQIYETGKLDMQALVYSIVVMSRANEESELKSQRLIAAWNNKRLNAGKKKMTKLAPAWLELSRDRTHYKSNSAKVSVIKEIFNMADSGLGAYSIARQLNDNAVKPFGRAKDWGKSSVSKILSNRAVMGIFQPHRMQGGRRIEDGPPIEDYFPKIIDKNLFFSVQLARAKRFHEGKGRKGNSLPNLFTNIAICQHCNSPMHYVNKGAGPKGGTYLKCSKSLKSTACSPATWRYADFEASFLFFCKEIDLKSILNAEAERTSQDKKKLQLDGMEQELAALKFERSQLYSMMKKSDVNSSFYENEMLLVGHKIKDIEISLLELRKSISNMDYSIENEDINYHEYIVQFQHVESYAKRIALRKLILKSVKTLKLSADGESFRNRLIKERLLKNASSKSELSRTQKYLDDVDQLGLESKGKQFSVVFADGTSKFVTVNPENPYVFDIRAEKSDNSQIYLENSILGTSKTVDLKILE